MQAKIKRILIACLIMVALEVAVAAQYRGEPLTQNGLLNQLQQTGKKAVKPAEIITWIKTYGVDFLVTPEVEQKLIAVGAKPNLIAAAKDNYRMPNSNKRASFLTITSNVGDAEFNIEGIGSVGRGVTDQPVLPGVYRITANRLGYVSETQSIDLQNPGSRRTASFTLKPVPVSQLLMDAAIAFDRREFRTVEELCRKILATEPSNPKANILIGRSYYARRDFVPGVDYLIKGIKSGESIALDLGRRRESFVSESLDAWRIVLKPSSISFTDGGKENFEIPYAKVQEVRPEKKYNGYVTNWRLTLKILVPKSTGKDDKKEFNFYVSSSRTELITSGSSTIQKIVCNDCEGESRFIADLINGLK